MARPSVAMRTNPEYIDAVRREAALIESAFEELLITSIVPKGEVILKSLRGVSPTEKLTKILAIAREIKTSILNERGRTSKSTFDYYKLFDSDLKNLSIRGIYGHFYTIRKRQDAELEQFLLLAAYQYAYTMLTNAELRNLRNTRRKAIRARRTLILPASPSSHRTTPNVFGVRNSPNSPYNTGSFPITNSAYAPPARRTRRRRQN